MTELPSFAGVDPISRSKHKSCFPNATPDALVITEISHLKAKHAGLNPGFNETIQCFEPITKWATPIRGNVLADPQIHLEI